MFAVAVDMPLKNPTQYHAAVRLRHQSFKRKLPVLQLRIGGNRNLTAAIQPGKKTALGLYANPGRHMLKKGRQLAQVFPVGTHFHTESPLPYGR